MIPKIIVTGIKIDNIIKLIEKILSAHKPGWKLKATSAGTFFILFTNNKNKKRYKNS
jgi:hypothetical protein